MDLYKLLTARVADILKAYVNPIVVEKSACVFRSVVAGLRTGVRPVNLVTPGLTTPEHHCFSLSQASSAEASVSLVLVRSSSTMLTSA
jgi:hypothetical protein